MLQLILQSLQPIRDFIRDVGTPIIVLIFCGLVYTGVLHSPLTDISQRTWETKSSADKAATNSQTSMDQHTTMMNKLAADAYTNKRSCYALSKLAKTDPTLCEPPEMANEGKQ